MSAASRKMSGVEQGSDHNDVTVCDGASGQERNKTAFPACGGVGWDCDGIAYCWWRGKSPKAYVLHCRKCHTPCPLCGPTCWDCEVSE